MTTSAAPAAPLALDAVFTALADDTRRRILGLLASGEVCVCHIHGALGVPQPTASRHLAHLRKAGLVATRREGQWIHYRLAADLDPEIAAIVKSAIAALQVHRSTAKDRRELSRLIDVPVRTLEQAARRCC
jgi:ArsR family transcriptional regulator